MDPNVIKPTDTTQPETSTPPEPQQPNVMQMAPSQPQPMTPPQGGSKKKLFGKISVIPAVIIGALLITAGSAAGYFGIIVPNKPENVLKTAIEKTALQTKSKFEGKFTYESTDPEAELKAMNITFKGQGDTEKNAFQSEFNITASGVSLPFELRSVDKSIFFKIGDLSTIKSLATASAPEYGPIIDAVNEKLADQWIEIDETLMKQAGTDCMVNTSFALTKADIELLQKRYQEVPFVAVKSTSSEEVNGRAAYKYVMELDDNKGAEYVKGLEELSVVKKIKECSKDTDPIDTEELADDDITPITIWVDKGSKTISKFVMNSTKQDEEKSNLKGSFEMTFQFGEAEVSKPEGARPAMEIIGELQALLMGGAGLDESFEGQSLGVFDF